MHAKTLIRHLPVTAGLTLAACTSAPPSAPSADGVIRSAGPVATSGRVMTGDEILATALQFKDAEGLAARSSCSQPLLVRYRWVRPDPASLPVGACPDEGVLRYGLLDNRIVSANTPGAQPLHAQLLTTRDVDANTRLSCGPLFAGFSKTGVTRPNGRGEGNRNSEAEAEICSLR